MCWATLGLQASFSPKQLGCFWVVVMKDIMVCVCGVCMCVPVCVHTQPVIVWGLPSVEQNLENVNLITLQ